MRKAGVTICFRDCCTTPCFDTPCGRRLAAAPSEVKVMPSFLSEHTCAMAHSPELAWELGSPGKLCLATST